jgi:hypothetical protein
MTTQTSRATTQAARSLNACVPAMTSSWTKARKTPTDPSYPPGLQRKRLCARETKHKHKSRSRPKTKTKTKTKTNNKSRNESKSKSKSKSKNKSKSRACRKRVKDTKPGLYHPPLDLGGGLYRVLFLFRGQRSARKQRPFPTLRASQGFQYRVVAARAPQVAGKGPWSHGCLPRTPVRRARA